MWGVLSPRPMVLGPALPAGSGERDASNARDAAASSLHALSEMSSSTVMFFLVVQALNSPANGRRLRPSNYKS